jgi:hypothetical protein
MDCDQRRFPNAARAPWREAELVDPTRRIATGATQRHGVRRIVPALTAAGSAR